MLFSQNLHENKKKKKKKKPTGLAFLYNLALELI